MALQESICVLSFRASVALEQWRFVDVDAANQRSVVYPAAGGHIVGSTLIDAPVVGQAVGVAHGGIVKVEASAPIAIGDYVASTIDGRGVTAVATNIAAGKAITAATAAGQIIEVVFTGPIVVA